ncbi:MAG TPA: bifunctional diaminohydroxyphosphoribosylaminopyrimidine deaminase/5-amino-6-(5-phosphoribosylamino)uracil reductase RibD [Acidimicrobiia bacterium]
MADPTVMGRAIAVAGQYRTHPNPRVGAVFVDDDGLVVGVGFHTGPGSDHAEVMAISSAGDRAAGATMYVTLEPCNHHGRTPPCVDAIVAAGITHVVVGTVDPDNRVSGSGISALIDASVKVTAWDSPGEVEAVDPGYFLHRRTGLPRVTLKYAMTLDGSVAAQDGTSRWITGDAAREDVHLLRSGVDAVVVGAGTLRQDDPGLDVRLRGYEGAQPRPVVIAGAEPLPDDARLIASAPLLITTARGPAWNSVEAVVVEGDRYPDPVASARALADYGYLDILLEGGPTVASAWWKAGLVSRGVAYLGAKVGGGLGSAPLAGAFASITDALDVEIVDVRRIGSDVRIEFH